MGVVGEKMAAMNITKKEMIALVGIVLLDPSKRIGNNSYIRATMLLSKSVLLTANQSLEQQTQELLQSLRNQLFKDVMRYYEADAVDNPEIRLGNLILLMSGVKVR